jgi:hypothetical protein
MELYLAATKCWWCNTFLPHPCCGRHFVQELDVPILFYGFVLDKVPQWSMMHSAHDIRGGDVAAGKKLCRGGFSVSHWYQSRNNFSYCAVAMRPSGSFEILQPYIYRRMYYELLRSAAGFKIK